MLDYGLHARESGWGLKVVRMHVVGGEVLVGSPFLSLLVHVAHLAGGVGTGWRGIRHDYVL